MLRGGWRSYVENGAPRQSVVWGGGGGGRQDFVGLGFGSLALDKAEKHQPMTIT